jgi:hypothetical protein
MPLNAGRYARLSTTNGRSVDMQLNDLRQFAQMRRFTITREYCDPGHSGAKDSRPALDAVAEANKRNPKMYVEWPISVVTQLPSNESTSRCSPPFRLLDRRREQP